jgi:glycosyltransferase involved in cell wall biosynthesis
MVMGSFPIQSNTSVANEWIESGKSGFIVPPEDAETVAVALKRALCSDTLVDSAQETNWQIAKQRVDVRVIAEDVKRTYREI